MLPLAGLRRFLASHTEMSSARNQPNQEFPAVPATLNAGEHELRDWPPNYSAPPNTTPYYTPYLGLRARLSQVWINRWTVLLILIIYNYNDVYVCQYLEKKVEENSKLTRGETVVDWYGVTDRQVNCKVITEANQINFFVLLKKELKKLN